MLSIRPASRCSKPFPVLDFSSGVSLQICRTAAPLLRYDLAAPFKPLVQL